MPWPASSHDPRRSVANKGPRLHGSKAVDGEIKSNIVHGQGCITFFLHAKTDWSTKMENSRCLMSRSPKDAV